MSVPAPAPSMPLHGRSVLVVDDEIEVCDMLVEFLEHLGARVEAVQDGRVALERLRSTAFHALVTDMRMPGFDGMSLVAAARQFDPGIVVIVMTGYASFDSALAVVRMGAHEYLKKPFDLAEVQRALSSGLSSRESRPVPPELEDSLAVEYQPGAGESDAGAEGAAARIARMASLCWDAPARDLNAAGLADALQHALRGAGAGSRVAIDARRLRVCPAGTDRPVYAFERPRASDQAA